MTDERFEEIIEVKSRECVEYHTFCGEYICTECGDAKLVKDIELSEFWQKVKELYDLLKSQLAKLQKYEQAEAERENPQPLKPEQLKELVNCPYWHKSLIGNGDKWAILPAYTAQNPEDYHYGEYWLAYRYKPKEDENE